MKHQADYSGATLPREATLDEFRLAPLTPECVLEDFYVVVASEPALIGLFEDSWPTGLTLEENHRDLERHDREFQENEAFSWVIRNGDGTYLGCAYVYPNRYDDGIGRIYTWVRARPDREDLLDRFNREFSTWLFPVMPLAEGMLWRSNYDADLDVTPTGNDAGVNVA